MGIRSVAVFLLVVGSRGSALASIIIDGNDNDWGIHPSAGDWSSSTGQRIFFEDYAGMDGDGHLGPGWGGQYLDVEAIYATRSGNLLCFAIVTGFDPDGVLHRGTLHTPGDIWLDVGSGWNVAIDLQTGHLFTGATGSSPELADAGPFQILGGTDLGSTPLGVRTNGVATTYTGPQRSARHHVIEGCIDLSLTGGLCEPTGIRWTMSSGSDVGYGYLDAPCPCVPEPTTIALAALGCLAVLARGRRTSR